MLLLDNCEKTWSQCLPCPKFLLLLAGQNDDDKNSKHFTDDMSGIILDK